MHTILMSLDTIPLQEINNFDIYKNICYNIYIINYKENNEWQKEFLKWMKTFYQIY